MSRRIIPFALRPARVTPATTALCAVRGPLRQREGECFGTLAALGAALNNNDSAAQSAASHLSPADQLALVGGIPRAVAARLLRAGLKRLDVGAFGLRYENERALRALKRAGAVPARDGLRLGGTHIEYL